MVRLKDLWVAEYSTIQRAFNVQSLERILQVNTDQVLSQGNNGYLIFGIFNSIEEADIACVDMEKKQKERKECRCSRSE